MNERPTVALIIVASGRGVRMGTPLPKQYLPLGDLPVLAVTLRRAAALLSDQDRLILVIPPADDARVKALLADYCPDHEVMIAHGGATRTDSVRSGLELVPEGTDLVAIHDGVRPFLTRTLWERLITATEESEAVIPVVPPVDSLRRLTEEGNSISVPLDRSRIRCVQTPQVFRTRAICDAYAAADDSPQTDDAGLYSHHTGRSPRLVEGDVDNIKITTPRDLATAEWILTHRSDD